MEIIFLGTGTGIPSVRRGSPALLLLHGKTTILVDCGAGTLRQLAKINLSFKQIDYLLFTHFHPDHTGDLIAYLFASRNKTAFSRRDPVRIIGPRGLLQLYEYLHKAFGHSVEPPKDLVSFEELPLEKHNFSLADLEVSAFPTPHTRSSLGYRFRTPSGETVAVTGDTGYSPELAENLKGVDLLVTECSFPDSQKIEGHLTPSLAGQLASEAEAGSLALNHFYPEVEGKDIRTSAGKEFRGELYLTEDLQKITL